MGVGYTRFGHGGVVFNTISYYHYCILIYVVSKVLSEDALTAIQPSSSRSSHIDRRYIDKGFNDENCGLLRACKERIPVIDISVGSQYIQFIRLKRRK
jgi:hypothetical protein